MAEESSLKETSLNQVNSDSSDSTIAINIKTLDSHLHSFRVKKNMRVPALKEKIVTTIGIPLEQQRLIYRGKVLKDDQLLSDHSVEDGDTLHLVVRPQVQSQPTSSTAASETSMASSQANDSGSGLQHPRVGQVAHSVFLGTVNIADRQGEAMPVDLSQIVPAVLNLLGAQNIGATGGPSIAPIVSTSNQAYSGNGTQSSQNTSHTQSGNSANGGFMLPNQPIPSFAQFSQMPSRGTVHQPLVISDALTTLTEFIDRMQGALPSSSNSLNNEQNLQHSATSSLDARGLPTPDFLGHVLERTQLLLGDNAVAALSNTTTRLQREGNSSDPLLRAQIQNEAMQLGVAMQHLGALLLELGRVTMTLRMGQTPAESSVYAGPAVYISSAGPNPIMVQPFPFQTSSLFGLSSFPLISELSSHGPGGPTSNPNIHLQPGSSAPLVPSSNGGVTSQPEAIHGQHLNVEQTITDGIGSSDSVSARGLSSRTVAVANQLRAIPDSRGQVLSVVYPLHIRTQQSIPVPLASQLFSTTISRGGQPNAPNLTGQPNAPNLTGQPNAPNLTGQPPLGSDYFPVVVAEVSAQIPMVPNGNAPVQSSSMQSSTTDGSRGAVNNDTHSGMLNPNLRTAEVYSNMHTTQLDVERNNNLCAESQHHNAIPNVEASVREDNLLSSQEGHLSGNDASVDPEKVTGSQDNKQRDLGENLAFDVNVSRKVEQQILLNGDKSSSMDSCISFDEPLTTKSGSCHTKIQTGSIPSCSSEIKLSKGEQMPAPLGLGVGGLQTKKRSKPIKSKGNGDGQVKIPSRDHSQQSFVRGNDSASQTNHVDKENANASSSQFPSLISQFMNNMPQGAQAGSGPTNLAGMMVNAMQSSGFSSLLSGVASHAGVPSGDLRSMVEQCVQNPAVQNTFSQLAQQVGQNGDRQSNVPTDHGRFDFKGMLQQLLPAVSQALGNTPPAITTNIQSEPLPELEDVPTSAVESLGYNDYQAELSEALETLQHHDGPRNMLGAMLKISDRLFGEQNVGEDLVEIGNDEELAEEFVETLRREIRRRLAKESTSKGSS